MKPAEFIKKGHGKTAPWVDLVNSEEWDTYGTRTDWLADRSWLPYFLKQWQLHPPSRGAFPRTRFAALRSVLRKSCEALVEGRAIPHNEIQLLNAALKVPGCRTLLQRQNGLQLDFVPLSRGWEWVLAQIAQSFADTLAAGKAERIRICPNDGCRWLFYDATKGKTRRWCSDNVCGNRARVRRARARSAR